MIQIGEPPPPGAIVQIYSSVPLNDGTSSGTLTVRGSNGNYQLAQITGLNDVTNYVEATGWNPATDEEIYALDVLVNGNQANAAQLATLINAIDGADGQVPASSEVTASTTNPGGVFPGIYNLFLTDPSDTFSTDYLAINLASSNDFNLAGYTFSAVAAVPEPMSLSILAAGAIGLMTRRNRKNAEVTP